MAEEQTAPEEPGPAGKVGRRGTGARNIFAVDRRAFVRACSLGMNAAVAYLVLGAFSGPDQRTTRAGVQAIEKRTGIARDRAKAALRSLEEAGLVSVATGIQRRIIPAHLLPVIPLDRFEQSALTKAFAGKELTAGERRFAEAAAKRGAAERLWKGRYRPISASEEPDWIWLPNELVTGAARETPPAELVRSRGDVLTLRLLVELYQAQNLASNGGIHWQIIRQKFQKAKIGQRGSFDVYGFVQEDITSIYPDASFLHSGLRNEAADNWAETFWIHWNRLRMLGLIEMVSHLVEADSKEAEPIHPYGISSGDELERDLARAAHRAGRAMVTDGQYEHATQEFDTPPWLIPIPRDQTSACLFGLARLRYRPKTALTASWYARMTEVCRSQIERYQELERLALD